MRSTDLEKNNTYLSRFDPNYGTFAVFSDVGHKRNFVANYLLLDSTENSINISKMKLSKFD